VVSTPTALPDDAGGDPERDPAGGSSTGGTGGDDDSVDGRTPVDYLKWAGVAVLAVTALVALFGFYTGVSRAITVWVSRSYRPVVNAGFNLALLLAALGGIGVLLRRAD
jgi:hypothetical protein